MSYKRHLFICTAAPEKEGKCGHKGSEALRKNLKDLCSKEPWGKEVRINSAGCLGHCEKGISTVLYPEGNWRFQVNSGDLHDLFQWVKTSTEETNK